MHVKVYGPQTLIYTGIRLTIKNESRVKHHVFVRSLKSRMFKPALGIISIESFRQRPHDSFKRHQRHGIRRESPINQSASVDRDI